MSSRPYDWEPLAPTDPVPGDPGEVRALSRELKKIAQTIQEQTEKLRTMCSDDYWDADAAKKFDDTAQDRAGELSKVYDRYHAAQTALDDYAPVLEDQQAETLKLRTQAQELLDARNAAQKRLDHDDAQPDDADPRPGHAMDSQSVAAYWSELHALQQKAAACVDAVHQAARAAADKLDDTIHHDGLKDGWTDHVRQWVHEHADIIGKIADIAGWIATIAGVLALAVGWIPIIGQALAAVLGAIALVATLVSLVCHLALLWSGDGEWLDVAFDVVGLLTFGVGRAAVSGIRGAAAAVKASGKMGKAAEAVLPMIVSKGGRVGEEVTSALTLGNLAKASQLSGIRRSLLKGWMGNAIGSLGQFGSGGVKAMTRVMAEGPGRFLPRTADFANGFKPSSYVDILKDGVAGVRSLIHDAPTVAADVRTGLGNLAHNPGGALGDLGRGVSGNVSFTPEVAEQLAGVRDLVSGMTSPVVHAADRVLDSQLTFNAAQWGGFTTVDLIDKTRG